MKIDENGKLIDCELQGKDIEKFVIPSNVSQIGYGSIANCDFLEEIVIGESVSKLDFGAIKKP